MAKRKRPDVQEIIFLRKGSGSASLREGVSSAALCKSLHTMLLQHLDFQGVSKTLVESLQAELVDASPHTDGSGRQDESELMKVFRYAMEGRLAFTVSAMSGVSYECEVDTKSSTIVRELKQRLEASLGISAFEQVLVFEDSVLHDALPLASCGITPCKGVVQVLRKQRRFAISGCGGILQCWDVENGECVCTLEGHAKTVSHVVVDWPSWRALSADDDGIIKLWDLKSADCIRTIKFQACHGKGFMDEISIHEVVADWPKQRALVAYGHVIKLWMSL